MSIIVAPLAGAWIEIRGTSVLFVFFMSLPSRERGLKFKLLIIYHKPLKVAPLAGAWIEIGIHYGINCYCHSRSPRGSVD